MEICSKFNSKFLRFTTKNGEEKPIICFYHICVCLILKSLLVLLVLVQKCVWMWMSRWCFLLFSVWELTAVQRGKIVILQYHWFVMSLCVWSYFKPWFSLIDFIWERKSFFIPKSLCQDWRDTLEILAAPSIRIHLQLSQLPGICSHFFPRRFGVCVCLCACVLGECVCVCVCVCVCRRRSKVSDHGS